MFLTVIGPAGHREDSTVATDGYSLGAFWREHADAIEACFINNRPTNEWQSYTPQKRDRVTIHVKSGYGSETLWVNLIIQIVIAAISIGIQMALAPKAAKLTGDKTEGFGITGFQNTTGQGQPIPVYWGEQRVFPHVIGGGVDVSPDHKNMLGRVLYCVGDTGGDEYQELSDVEIDEVPVTQYDGVQVHYRLGSMTQSVIPEFSFISTPWFDGRTIPYDETTETGTPLVYQTRSSNVNRAKVTFAFQNGLWRVNGSGKRRADIVAVEIFYRPASDPDDSTYVRVMPRAGEWVGDSRLFHFEADTQAAIYFQVAIDFSSICQAAANQYWADRPDVAADPYYGSSPSHAYEHWIHFGQSPDFPGVVWHSELCGAGKQYLIKFQVSSAHPAPSDEPHSTDVTLYNVEEITFTTDSYPGYALLGLTNIPARQVKSLQSMAVSVYVKGKKVRDYANNLVYNPRRDLVIRDMMTGPCGMDYEFDDDELNLGQWLLEGSYYDELVPGHIETHTTVASATSTQVNLSTPVALTSGTAYFLIVTRQSDGHVEFRGIATWNGLAQITVSPAFSFNPMAGDAADIAPQEKRDQCDFACTQRKWDWDHVRSVAGEGRAVVVPSNDKWNYIINKPGTPNLLFSEPGNIVEDSIQMEIGPQDDDPYNQIIAEFRDADDSDRPGLAGPIDGPDAPYPSIVQKAIHFDTIRRESQAMREMMILIKRQFLERRRWTFVTPIGRIVSEPWDIDWLAERSVGDIGAYTGFIGAGSTTTTITLDREAVLEPATTYLLVIQRQDNSPVESRLVSTAAGTWMQVTVASPFSVAPTAGRDLYSLGKLNIDHIMTRAQDLKIDNDGRVTQVRTEYLDDVYTADPIPPKNIRRHFPLISIPPIPLRDAFVKNQVVLRQDGSWGSVVIFDVTPGLISVSAFNSGVVWPKVWIPIQILPQQIQAVVQGPFNSFQRYYFRDAYWRLTSGSGAGLASKRRIIDWDPNAVTILGTLSYNATLEGSQPPGPITGEACVIEFERFSDTTGFKIELSTDGQAWAEVARAVGFHHEMDGGDQGGTFYYRFTPYNASQVENKIARLVKGPITLSGDNVAPPAPLSVLAFATTSFITVEATFQMPMALDFAGIEILVREFQIGGFPVHKVYNILPVVQTRTDATRENGTSGTVPIRKTVDVRNIFQYPPPNGGWDAQVRAYDYSGNKSAWVLSNDFYPQRLSQNDIA